MHHRRCGLALLLALAACGRSAPETVPAPASPPDSTLPAARSSPATAADNAQRPWRDLTTRADLSLIGFPAEESSLATELGIASAGVTDSALNDLLSRKLVLPANLTVAVLHLPGAGTRGRWGADEATTEMTQALADTSVRLVSSTSRVQRALPLPSLLVSNQHTVAAIREATARLQADVALVYRPSCRNYERVPFIGPVEYRAVCTIQAILLDARSGLIPFATIVTHEQVTQKGKREFQATETVLRAQMGAIAIGLSDVAARLSILLSSLPAEGHPR